MPVSHRPVLSGGGRQAETGRNLEAEGPVDQWDRMRPTISLVNGF
jgi:hypothetical protein